ncbi:Fe-S cluster assembly sulfur transfer protein SufU [Sporosalibacterium faouarense]|uniref:Fe-S cluster assembly sulfur transfer protein SufU n=1 Tax=Sporosalibacterium faouarense TaxID=516123 RepID=UPI00141C0D27|nr:SUF system NifU family Fe-S cluster assembly protein [Sporosalibacterium faouarense]MTI46371.1 SUF system NifU family Fe-S cluster assembly protein [Bacillota bacterium]
MNLDSIYTEIITEYSQSKHNERTIDSPTKSLKGHNPSCGDEINLEIKIKDNIIEDAAFTGVGCAISRASTSIMIDLIKGKRIKDALNLVDTFIGMIKREITNDEDLEILEDAMALKNISNLPARVKCAVLAWHTLKQALE